MNARLSSTAPPLTEAWSTGISSAELEQLRERLRMSPGAFARFLGIGRTTYLGWRENPAPLSAIMVLGLHLLQDEATRCEAARSEAEWTTAAALLGTSNIAWFVSTRGLEPLLADLYRSAPRLDYHPPEPVWRGAVGSAEIVALRGELGWKQTDLATFMGVAQSTVSTWELEAETTPAIFVGVLRALLEEVEHRATTLVYRAWKPYTARLQALGAPAFLLRWRKGADWDWRAD